MPDHSAIPARRALRDALLVVTLLPFGPAACGIAAQGAVPPHVARQTQPAAGAGISVRGRYTDVLALPGVHRSTASGVLLEAERLHALVGRDLGVFQGRLRIALYPDHRTFARALWRMQRARPQTRSDDTSSVVHGNLLLGPLPRAYLRHNLVHVYTEWVIDRLIGNRSDALPDDPWFYDGLAEYEAYRYEPAGMPCSVRGEPFFDVTTIRTARRWLALRPTPLGSLEYCLAYQRVRSLVTMLGWHEIERVLHGKRPWTATVRQIEREAASRSKE